MEYLIMLCLVIIIMILILDKFKVKKIKKDNLVKEKYNPQLPNIMGQPRPSQSQRVPNKTFNIQESELEIDPSHLDIEYDANENIISQDRQEEQDYTVNHSANLEEEEEELSLMYGRSDADSGFAHGVTFEELSAVGIALQNSDLEPSQKEIAVSTIQKIQGTELFALLENSMESASIKIAALLDSSLSNETSPSLMRNDNFSIDDFI